MSPSALADRDGHLIESWYVACLGSELGARRPVQRVIYDRPLVLFRGEGGRPVCLPDRCLHRHAQLSEGAVFDGRLGCPYHGWTYDARGVVVDVPSEGPGGRREHPELCLKPLPVTEQDGCIWVWTGDGPAPSTTPPFRFPHLNQPGWRSYFMVTDFANEVTHLVENFMDVPHTLFVHRGWFRRASRKPVPIEVQTGRGQVLVTYHRPDDDIGFSGRVLNPRKEPMAHTDLFLMPNLTRVDYAFGSRKAFVIVSQCTPVSTLQTRVYTAIVFRLGWLAPLLEPFLKLYTRRVIEQDVAIMENQGRSLRRDMTPRFRATDADVVHASIERLRALGADGHPAAWNGEPVTVEKQIWI